MESRLESSWMYKKIELSKEHQRLAFASELNERIITGKKGKVLIMEDGREVVEFCSNTYLGLDDHPKIRQAAKDSIDRFGIEVATARTRLIPDFFAQWSKQLDQIFGGHTVIFKSVGPVHTGFFPVLGASALPSYPISKNGVYWIVDKYAHATIQVQIALMGQFGDVTRVNFEDPHALQQAFTEARERSMTPVTVSDSIGSMGGVVDLQALKTLTDEFGGYAYLDDAHGTSVFGRNGAGYIHHVFPEGIPPRFILVSSLAKAFGAHGGCVTLPTDEDARMLKRFAVPYVFGGSVPLPSVAAGIAAADIHLSDEITLLQTRLQENLTFFDDKAASLDLTIDNFQSIIPIRGIVIGDEHKCIRIAKELLEKGYFAVAAAYPTVAKGRSLIRVSISSDHSHEQITGLLSALKDIIQST